MNYRPPRGGNPARQQPDRENILPPRGPPPSNYRPSERDYSARQPQVRGSDYPPQDPPSPQNYRPSERDLPPRQPPAQESPLPSNYRSSDVDNPARQPSGGARSYSPSRGTLLQSPDLLGSSLSLDADDDFPSSSNNQFLLFGKDSLFPTINVFKEGGARNSKQATNPDGVNEESSPKDDENSVRQDRPSSPDISGIPDQPGRRDSPEEDGSPTRPTSERDSASFHNPYVQNQDTQRPSGSTFQRPDPKYDQFGNASPYLQNPYPENPYPADPYAKKSPPAARQNTPGDSSNPSGSKGSKPQNQGLLQGRPAPSYYPESVPKQNQNEVPATKQYNAPNNRDQNPYQNSDLSGKPNYNPSQYPNPRQDASNPVAAPITYNRGPGSAPLAHTSGKAQQFPPQPVNRFLPSAPQKPQANVASANPSPYLNYQQPNSFPEATQPSQPNSNIAISNQPSDLASLKQSSISNQNKVTGPETKKPDDNAIVAYESPDPSNESKGGSQGPPPINAVPDDIIEKPSTVANPASTGNVGQNPSQAGGGNNGINGFGFKFPVINDRRPGKTNIFGENGFPAIAGKLRRN